MRTAPPGRTPGVRAHSRGAARAIAARRIEQARERSAARPIPWSLLVRRSRAPRRGRLRSARAAVARSRTCCHRRARGGGFESAPSRRDRQGPGSRVVDGLRRGRLGPSSALATVSGDVRLLDKDRVRRAPPFRGAGGVFPGSGVLGFLPARALVAGVSAGVFAGVSAGVSSGASSKSV